MKKQVLRELLKKRENKTNEVEKPLKSLKNAVKKAIKKKEEE